MSSAPRHAGAPIVSPGESAPGASATSSGLTSRRHVDYGRVRSAICPA